MSLCIFSSLIQVGIKKVYITINTTVKYLSQWISLSCSNDNLKKVTKNRLQRKSGSETCLLALQ